MPTATLASSAERKFPNALAAPTSAAAKRPRYPWAIAVLLVLWLVPRLMMAQRVDVLCPDAAVYIGVAQSLEHVDEGGRLNPMDFNLYPTLLMVMHGMGLEWETAAKLWGVLCGTLLVLPLYGWIRRQLDERTAIIACALLAFHPKLIQWTPEMVRDPTFCLLLATSLYLTWRAVTEVRMSLFLAAGVATVCAIHTRFEGWFLFVPLLLWVFWRQRQVVADRWPLVKGMLVFCACYPVILVALNLCFGSYYSSWILGSNLHRVVYLRHWQQATTPPPTPVPSLLAQPSSAVQATVIAQPPVVQAPEAKPVDEHLVAPAPPEQYMTNAWATWLMSRTLYRGFSPFYGFLTLVGLFAWRRTWLKCDHQPLFYVALVTATGIWFHTWEAKASSSRYALALVILAAPFAALGFSTLASRLARGYQALSTKQYSARLVSFQAIVALFLAFIAASFAEVVVAHDPGGRSKSSLGSWMLESFGGGRHIVGTPRFRLSGYYAHSQYSDLKPSHELKKVVASTHPDVFVLDCRGVNQTVLSQAIAGLEQMQYSRIDTSRLPEICRDEVVVLIRSDEQARTSSQTR